MKYMGISIIGQSDRANRVHKYFNSSLLYETDSAIDLNSQEVINKTAFCFICTPACFFANGEIDISNLENFLEWIEAEIIIINTLVPPRTTEYFNEKYKKNVVFLSDDHHFSFPFLCGGNEKDTKKIEDLFLQEFGNKLKFHCISSVTAELFAFSTNIWTLIQRTISNEFQSIADVTGANFDIVQKLWAQYVSQFSSTHFVQGNLFDPLESKGANELSALIFYAEKYDLTSYFLDGLNRARSFYQRKNQEKLLCDSQTNPKTNLKDKEKISPKDKEKEVIKFYQVDHLYGYFSNFSKHPIFLKNKIWMTSEHYYQAQKYENTPNEEKIRRSSSPVKAARLGKKNLLLVRKDWDDVKDKVMFQVLYAKFTQHPELNEKLLETYPSILIEHTRNDHYWGDGGDGSGKNKLGLILMEVRNQLR